MAPCPPACSGLCMQCRTTISEVLRIFSADVSAAWSFGVQPGQSVQRADAEACSRYTAALRHGCHVPVNNTLLDKQGPSLTPHLMNGSQQQSIDDARCARNLSCRISNKSNATAALPWTDGAAAIRTRAINASMLTLAMSLMDYCSSPRCSSIIIV